MQKTPSTYLKLQVVHQDVGLANHNQLLTFHIQTMT